MVVSADPVVDGLVVVVEMVVIRVVKSLVGKLVNEVGSDTIVVEDVEDTVSVDVVVVDEIIVVVVPPSSPS